MQLIAIRIPKELHKKVKVYAAMNGVTMAELVKKLLEEKLKEKINNREKNMSELTDLIVLPVEEEKPRVIFY